MCLGHKTTAGAVRVVGRRATTLDAGQQLQGLPDIHGNGVLAAWSAIVDWNQATHLINPSFGQHHGHRDGRNRYTHLGKYQTPLPTFFHWYFRHMAEGWYWQNICVTQLGAIEITIYFLQKTLRYVKLPLLQNVHLSIWENLRKCR